MIERMFGLKGDFIPSECAPAWVDDDHELAIRVTEAALAEPPAEDRWVLPPLEGMAPGFLLGVLLEGPDRSRLNGHDLVRLLQATERQVAHLQAQSAAVVVEVAYTPPGSADGPVERGEFDELAADEVRAALVLTRRAAAKRLGLALDLVERLPRLWGILSAGQIDLSRARVIADGVSNLSAADARRVVDQIADRAPNLTTGQLGALIRRLAITVNPSEAEERYEQAVSQRSLHIEQGPDGAANVCLYDIPVDAARAIGRRVNAHAVSLRRAGDTRDYDNLRADIAADLLMGTLCGNGGGGSGRGAVEIKVDATTLAGLDENPGYLPGIGPIIADVARRMVDQRHDARWLVVVADDQGRPTRMATTRRRPDTALSRYVGVTQPTCSFPGCRMPASDCDLDHLVPWSQGGATSSDNLGPKCRHDHQLKDHGWTHQHADGKDTWTSPRSHIYTTHGPSP